MLDCDGEQRQIRSIDFFRFAFFSNIRFCAASSVDACVSNVPVASFQMSFLRINTAVSSESVSRLVDGSFRKR
jgi:hypothetical protein